MKAGGTKRATNSLKNADFSEKSIRFAADTIIENALNLHATDVHIEPRDGLTIVRMRIHGTLNTTSQLPADISSKLANYFKKIAGLSIREKNFTQVGNYQHGGAKIRVSSSPTFSGEKITLRLIRARTSLRKLDEIGLWGNNLRLARQALRQPNGLIITVGEGKNTTNFALLDEINAVEKNIVTVENSIEKTLSGINQTETKPKIGLNFFEATKAAFNQNPDVVLINDLSDSQTAKIAIDASMRGKLIIASLPVRRASEAIPFLSNLGISPFLISTNVLAIIEQTLVRTTPKSALTEVKLSKTDSIAILAEFAISPKEIHELEISAKKNELEKNSLSTTNTEISRIYKLKDLQNLNFSDVTSIFGIISLLDGKTGEKLQNFVLSNPTNSQITNFLAKEKIPSLRIDGLVKSLRGEFPLEELLRKTGL